MAGHSHWSKIKRAKGANDAKRGKIWSKVAKKIMIAAKNGGDPRDNLNLRYTIDEAKGVNMPKDTIEKAIKKGTGELGAENYESVMYEAYAPGGVAMMIEGLHRDAKTNAVVHHALGLLSWDAGAKEYRMATALDFGRGGYFPGKLEGNRFTWTLDRPGGPRQRYVITVEGDRWLEVGERTSDGATWETFFHMELTRAK